MSKILASAINLNLTAKTKKDVISKLIKLLPKNRVNNFEECLDAVLCRETLGSTDIGRGISIPRAKTAAASKLSIAIGISKKGVDTPNDFDKLNIFFLVLSPINQKNEYLSLISKLAKLSRDSKMREKLMQSKKTQEIQEIIENYL